MIKVLTPQNSMRAAFVATYLDMYDLQMDDEFITRSDGDPLTPQDVRVSREMLQRCGVAFEETTEGE